MNCPMVPVMSSIGTKAATVVSTVHTTGQATSAVPAMAASLGLMPSVMWR